MFGIKAAIGSQWRWTGSETSLYLSNLGVIVTNLTWPLLTDAVPFLGGLKFIKKGLR